MAPSCVLHESSTAGNLVSDMCSGFFQDILLPATVAICLKSLWYPFYCQEQGYRNSTAYSEQVNMSLLELTLWMLLNQSTNSLNSFLKKVLWYRGVFLVLKRVQFCSKVIKQYLLNAIFIFYIPPFLFSGDVWGLCNCHGTVSFSYSISIQDLVFYSYYVL